MARQRYQKGRIEKSGKTPKWKGHFYIYDEAGKRFHKLADLGFCSKVTKTAAEKKFRQILEKETGVVKAATDEDTFEWFWTERYAPLKAWSDKTRTWIKGIFRRDVLPVLGQLRLAEIQKIHIQLLMKRLETKSHSLSRAVRTYVKMVFEELDDQGMIVKNPCRKVDILAKRPSRRKRHIGKEELDLLLGELNSRDRLIVRIAIVCGLRPAELFALKWDDFFPQTSQLRIDETYSNKTWKPTKTEESDGWVSMPPAIAKQLQLWHEQNPEGQLIFSGERKFDCPIDADDFVTRNLRRAAVRAGVMPNNAKDNRTGEFYGDKKTAVNFQAFRRTCATWCLQTGNIKDAQTQLRHINPATTLGYYIQEVPASVRATVESVDAHFFANVKPARLQSSRLQ
jgi:integrase